VRSDEQGDFLLGGADRGEDAVGVRQQCLPGCRQSHRAPNAYRERCSDGVFETPHLVADRGLGVAECAACGGI